jgi:hypothetical protein
MSTSFRIHRVSGPTTAGNFPLVPQGARDSSTCSFEVLLVNVDGFVDDHLDPVKRQWKPLGVPAGPGNEARRTNCKRHNRYSTLQRNMEDSLFQSPRRPVGAIRRDRSGATVLNQTRKFPRRLFPFFARRTQEQPLEAHQAEHGMNRIHVRRGMANRGVSGPITKE